MQATQTHIIEKRAGVRWRRVYASVILFAAVGIALGGCNRDSQVSADGRKQVRFLIMLLSTQLNEHYKWVEQTFEERNPDIDLVVQQFPGSSLKDYEIKLRLQFSSRRAPDVFGIQQTPMSDLARLGLLDPAPADMVRFIEENSRTEMIRESAYIDGVAYGPVTDASPTVLYYNKDMFREAGLDPERPPETWEELVEYADRLTVRRPDGTPIRAGLSLRKTGFKAGTAEKWFTFLYSAGGRAFTEGGTASAFNSEAGRKAINLYKTILFDKRIDATEVEGDQSGFARGTTAMFIREVHIMRWLAENYPNLDYGVANLPGGPLSISAGGGYLFVVSGDSPHKDESWRFIEFLMSDEVYKRYAAIGGVIPTTKSVGDLPEYRDDPQIRVFVDQELKALEPFPRLQRAAEIIGEHIERFCYGYETAEEFLERAAADVDAYLAVNAEEAQRKQP